MSGVWDEMNGVGGRVEREARREQAAAEVEARQLQLSSRMIADVAWEAMQQGRRVHVRWVGGEMIGVPTAAVGDLIVVPTDVGAAGINVVALSSVEVIGASTDRGSVGDRTVESFVAWCRMLLGRAVRVAVNGGAMVEGDLAAVATDHLLVRTRHGSDVAVSQAQAAAVSVVGEPFAF